MIEEDERCSRAAFAEVIGVLLAGGAVTREEARQLLAEAADQDWHWRRGTIVRLLERFTRPGRAEP